MISREHQISEVQGRASLWLDALNDCKWSLLISIRARQHSGPATLANGEREAAEYRAYRRNQIDFREGEKHNEDQWHRYLLETSNTFIESRESTWLGLILPMLAVVRFAAIFGSGKDHRGLVGNNLSPHVGAFREKVISAAFPSSGERARFDGFVESVKLARDGFVAHGQGTAAQRTLVRPGWESMRPATFATMDWDLTQWLSDVMAFHKGLIKELGRLASN